MLGPFKKKKNREVKPSLMMKRGFILRMPRNLRLGNHQDLRQTYRHPLSLPLPLMVHMLSLPLTTSASFPIPALLPSYFHVMRDLPYPWSKPQKEPVYSLGPNPTCQVTWWVTLGQVILPCREAWHCSLVQGGLFWGAGMLGVASIEPLVSSTLP